MNFKFLSMLLLILVACNHVTPAPQAALPQNKLTLRRIFDDPDLNGLSPRALRFSPDGKRVTYLKGKPTNARQLDLWKFDVDTRENRLLVDSSQFLTGPENLSDEEKARRERQRISQTGIVEYIWSDTGNALLFPLEGALYYLPIGATNATPKRITREKQTQTDAHLSPKGNFISLVRNGNLHLLDTQTTKEQCLTSDGSEVIKNGVAEFVAQEEMDRFAGQWWSDDEKYLAFTRTDESKVEVAKRFEISAEGADIYAQRYPRTGTPNASVRLGVVTISKSRAKPTIRWLTLANTPNIYLARVNWLPDNQTLAVQIQSRDQKRLDLFFYDVKSGKRKLILSETDPHWVNLHHDLRFLRQKKQFIWSSERSGVRQLYLYDWSGKLVHQLTRGSLPIHAVEAVDSSESQVFFTGSTDTPPEQHLFKASLETADVVQISQEEGWHDVTMIAKAPFYVDSYSNPMQPNQVSIRSFTGEKLTYLEENSLDAKHPLTPYVSGFSTPIFGSLKNASGTILYYQLLKPKNFQAGQKYPVIVDVYGGPGHQNVRKAWAGKSSLWHQYMAEQGYVIFSLDNRGSSHRERAFEDAIHNELGRAEVEDQKAGIEFLIASGIADPNRIGIFGWSYGGYMTLMSLLNEPALFSAGVSVAPVTDWSLYDTHYTERFLGTPGENPNGYAKSNVLPNIDRLRGKLLLMHGMADDNVLFTNSTKLLHAIQERILPVELMLYPGGKHGLSGKSRQSHVYETIDNFFARNL